MTLFTLRLCAKGQRWTYPMPMRAGLSIITYHRSDRSVFRLLGVLIVSSWKHCNFWHEKQQHPWETLRLNLSKHPKPTEHLGFDIHLRRKGSDDSHDMLWHWWCNGDDTDDDLERGWIRNLNGTSAISVPSPSNHTVSMCYALWCLIPPMWP